jgi:hypothetical protein
LRGSAPPLELDAPCEHAFVTSQGTAHGRFVRAIDSRNVWAAEIAAKELGRLPLGDALKLTILYASTGSEKFEPAAVRWLGRLALERGCPLTSLQLAAAALTALGGSDRETASRRLFELCR